MDYRKYYFLEEYLFNEVTLKFRQHGYLEPEDFFAIIIWKSNRAKTKVLDGIIKSGETVKNITSKVYCSATREDKLRILTPAIKGIGIPIASAILAVCYPDDFTIVDYRARAALKSEGVTINGDPSVNPKAFFEYVDVCKKLANDKGFSLREFDQELWGKDFCVGNGGLKELIDNLG